MNRVSITFSPLKRYPQISIDGDHISPYSDLASCENKDLHVSASRIFKLLDEELGNEYQIDMQATPFQVELMSSLAKQSEFCTGVNGTEIPLQFSIDEVVVFASKLVSNYSLSVDSNTDIKASGGAVEQLHCAVIRNENDPDLLIESEMPSEVEKGKTILLISEHYGIKNTRGNNIVEVPANKVDDFCQYYQLFTKIIPFVETAFSQAGFKALSKADITLLEAYTTQTAKYSFEISKTELDVGASVPYVFEVYPASAKGSFTLSADRSGAIAFTNGSIVAKQDGIVTLYIKDQSNKTIESKQLTISKHSYVTSIRLISSATSIEVGKKAHIDAYVVPENAEDAKSLKWNSSNTDVIHVTSSGDLVAIKPGTAVITVSSINCSEQITITACPSLEKISLSQSTLTVEVGKSQSIECNLYPVDASHGELIWELSNDGMGTLNVSSDGKTCTFTATTSSLAKGSLKCRVKGSEKNASCAVEIIPENRPTGLLTCTLIFSILGLVGSFLIPVIWAGGGGIGGFFADIFLPVGIILSLIGKAKTENKEKTFKTMLTLDLVFTGVMFFIAITCCNPRR